MKNISLKILLFCLWLACYFPFKHSYVLSENSLDYIGVVDTEAAVGKFVYYETPIATANLKNYAEPLETMISLCSIGYAELGRLE